MELDAGSLFYLLPFLIEQLLRDIVQFINQVSDLLSLGFHCPEFLQVRRQSILIEYAYVRKLYFPQIFLVYLPSTSIQHLLLHITQ